jgi:predicted MPP superfamily phosphohydrolase
MRSPWKIEIGSSAPPEVRVERVGLPRIDRPFRVLFMSDLHLVRRKTEQLVEQLKEIVAAANPELVLLGGDLVDKRSGLPQLSDLVSFACRQCLVGAIGGNHDRRVGIDLVARAVERAGGVWLDREPIAFSVGAVRIVARGADAPRTSPAEVSILCAHYPNAFASKGSPEDDLVFAGHLHGCQMTAFAWRGRSYPGAWFYRWNGSRFARRDSVMLVSRGLRDLVPIRVNCPREVVLCHCVGRE